MEDKLDKLMIAISNLIEQARRQEQERILEIIYEEKGIDFTGIELQKYSINDIKEMLEKAIKTLK